MDKITYIPDKGRKKRVIIIGGGFAGLKVARRLDRKLFQVILFDKNNYHQFQPLFYQVATSGLEPASIAFPFRKIFQKKDSFHFRLCTATRIIPETNTVETNIGSLDYDYLVISTGCDTNFFGNKKIEQTTLTLKSIPEALDIRNHILQSFEDALTTKDCESAKAFLNFVIVGGGPTGVEMAGALAEMRRYILPKDYPELRSSDMNVLIIDASSRLLGSMSEKASQNSLKFLKKLDVEVKLNCAVKDYDGKVLELANGEKINSSNVFWVAGIKGTVLNGIDPASYTKGYRIIVDRYNKVKGYDNIYALGDNCLMTEENYPSGHPQVAQAAIQQAKLLTENFKRLLKKKAPVQFRYIDKGSMATIGRNLAVADIGFLKISGLAAWMIWLFVHLMAIVGIKNRLFVFLNWVWNYFTFDQSLRLLFKGKSESKGN